MIKEIFTTPIYKNKAKVDCKKLETLAYEEKRKDPVGRKISNNGYQTQALDFNKYKFLFDEISKHATGFYKQFNTKINLTYASAWINISNKGHFNKLHSHGNSIISGVFYIKIPKDSGKIVFDNPCPLIEYFYANENVKKFNTYNSTEWEFEPIEGEIIMFPSYLKHYVQTNETNKDRISLSFNFKKANL
tara:strand:- start:98 stop:667 length:570 start_codon:yes stop_codon:yes gene_type:complete